MGLASTFADVYRFWEFAAGFREFTRRARRWAHRDLGRVRSLNEAFVPTAGERTSHGYQRALIAEEALLG